MLICQYCGRPHQTDVPDPRFCSTNCRQRQELFLEASGYTSDGSPTILDYSLTEADYLAHHMVALSKRAAQIVQEAEESDDEEAVARKKDVLLEDLARGNSVAEKIHRLTKPHSYSTGADAGKGGVEQEEPSLYILFRSTLLPEAEPDDSSRCD